MLLDFLSAMIKNVITRSSSVSYRNAKVALIVTFLSDLAFILPVWILFGTEQLGFSVTTTTILFMTLWLGSGLLEIPTGALADRYGRKKSFLLGTALLAFYPLVYITHASMGAIFAASLIAAFGSALKSGALLPLVHDSYKKDGRGYHEYHKFLSNERVLTFVARALSGVAGGIMYTLDPSLPYMAIFVSNVAMIIVGSFAVDPKSNQSKFSQRTHIKEALLAMKRIPIITILLVSYVAVKLVGDAMWTAYQPFFKSDGFTAQGIGLIFSVIAMISAVGAYSSRYFMKRMGVLAMQLPISFMIVATCLMLASPAVILRTFAIIPSSFVFGLVMVPVIATVQKHVGSKFHSTALSVVSVLQYGVYGVASLCIAFIIDTFGIDGSRKILVIEAMAMIIVVIALYIRNKDHDEVVSSKHVETELAI